MYHLGVVRALIESKLYDDIKVISGTSGGSIMVSEEFVLRQRNFFAVSQLWNVPPCLS
jgi:hypothetical protein